MGEFPHYQPCSRILDRPLDSPEVRSGLAASIHVHPNSELRPESPIISPDLESGRSPQLPLRSPQDSFGTVAVFSPPSKPRTCPQTPVQPPLAAARQGFLEKRGRNDSASPR